MAINTGIACIIPGHCSDRDIAGTGPMFPGLSRPFRDGWQLCLGFGAGSADQGPLLSRSTTDTYSHPESQKHATTMDEAGDGYTKLFFVCFSFEIQLIC